MASARIAPVMVRAVTARLGCPSEPRTTHVPGGAWGGWQVFGLAGTVAAPAAATY